MSTTCLGCTGRLRCRRGRSARAALDDPTTIHGWRIDLDDHRPTAYPADYEYVEELEP